MSALTVAYRVEMGRLTLDSGADPRTELLELQVRRVIGGLADRCRIELHAPPAPQPDLMAQALSAAAGALGIGDSAGAAAPAAFEIAVRGETLKPGDALTVDLKSGAVTARVMTARIDAIRSNFGRTIILGTGPLQTLAQRRVNRVWLDQSFGGVLRDLAGDAGIEVGDIANGATYPYIVAHESRTALDHVRELARREGCDVFADAEGKLVARPFTRESADHVLHYGIHILDADVLRATPAHDRARVDGESPASQRGAERWYWLAQDIAPFRAELGSGERARAVRDAVLRTRDAAQARATALIGGATDQAVRAQVRVLGNPAIGPGDAVEIKGAPKSEMNGVFRVVAVEHRFGKRIGYVTTLALTGRGGADAAGDLLGEALGALAGAVGL